MSDQVTNLPASSRPFVFRGSLVRTVVIALLIFSVLPAATIGAISYLRFRNTIQTQTQTQLSAVSQTYAVQIGKMVADQQVIVSDIIDSALSNPYLRALLAGPSDNAYNSAAYNYHKLLADAITSKSDQGLQQIDIVNAQGTVIISSDSSKTNQPLSGSDFLKSQLGTSQSTLTYAPNELMADELALITTQTIDAGENNEPLTVISYSSPSLLQTLLTNPLSIYSYAHVFYITSDNQIVSMNPSLNEPVSVNVSQANKDLLTQMVEGSGSGKNYSYVNFAGNAVYSFIKKMGSFNGTYVFEVPTSSIFSQLQPLLNFMLILLGITLVLIGLITFFASRQFVRPLVDLSNNARRYANGDFSQKASVSRRDEIGLLANSFNNMVDQLSQFYQSLEARVATRTESLRTSLEIGQEATTSSTRNEIFDRTVQLIVEKLGFKYAAIYSLDAAGKTLHLSNRFSTETEGLPETGSTLPVENTSLVGWVANNNEARLSQDITNERPRLNATAHWSAAKSEFAVPIAIGGKCIAVLNLQSEQVNGFDIESIPSFTIITRQIEAGLQNIALLESTQENYQQTILLYQATREFIQANTPEALYESLTNVFKQSDLVGMLLDVKGEEVRVVNIADAQPTPLDEALLGTEFSFGKAIEKLAKDGMELTSNFQYLTDFSTLNAQFGRRGCSSNAVLPVYEGKDLRHILAIGSRSESSLTAVQMQPFAHLAGTLGASLERIHLKEEITKSGRRLDLLKQIATIANSVDEPDPFGKIHAALNTSNEEKFGFCVALNDPAKGEVTLPYFFDSELIGIEKHQYSTDLLTKIIQTGQPILAADVLQLGQRIIESPTFQRTAHAVVGAPFFKGNQVAGAVLLFDVNNPDRFDANSQIVMSLIASQVGAIVEEKQLLTDLNEARSARDRQLFILNALLENIPDRVAVKDQNNRFVAASRTFARYVGISSPSELTGKPDTYLFTTEGSESLVPPDEEVFSSGQPVYNQQERWKKASGDEEWVITSKVPLNSPDGSLRGLLNIYQDVTNMVNAENLARHRADQLLTASDIARESSSGTMDIQETLARLVELIRSRFGFYHSSIFLVDPLGKFAVLRESTGEAGAQMKQRGHKLSVGSASIVGQATGKGVPVVIGDVTKEANYFANPLLPETRSELAIPLKIGERILGALDVQSQNFNAFSQEDINILQVLADQIAVAIQNADLFTHTNETLTRHRLLHRVTDVNVQAMTVEDAVRSAIETLHQAMPEERIAYLNNVDDAMLVVQASAGYAAHEITVTKYQFNQGVIGSVAHDRQTVRLPEVQTNPAYYPISVDSNSVLTVPVSFGERLLGVINIESTRVALFDENDQEYVTTLANNLASIITNIELVDQVKSQVERQQKLFEITDKIRRSVDIETIMQTSVSEICSALNVKRATIEINPNLQGEPQKEQE